MCPTDTNPKSSPCSLQNSGFPKQNLALAVRVHEFHLFLLPTWRNCSSNFGFPHKWHCRSSQGAVAVLKDPKPSHFGAAPWNGHSPSSPSPSHGCCSIRKELPNYSASHSESSPSHCTGPGTVAPKSSKSPGINAKKIPTALRLPRRRCFKSTLLRVSSRLHGHPGENSWARGQDATGREWGKGRD